MVGDDIKIRLGIEKKQFDQGLKQAQGTIARFAGAAKVALAGIGVGAAIQFSKKILNMADDLQTAADTIGQTTEFIQEFRIAAGQAGVATNTADRALQKFTRGVGEARNGTGELKSIIYQYGIALNDSTGKARTTTDVLGEFADAIKKTKDPAERLRIATKAFGDEGAQLIGLLKDGKIGFDALRATASKGIISQSSLNNLNKVNNMLKLLTAEGLAKTAGVLGFVAEKGLDFSTFIGGFRKGGPDAGADAVLESQRKRAAALVEMNVSTIAMKSEERLKAERQITGELIKQAEIHNNKVNQLQRTKADRTKFTLEELSQVNANPLSFIGREKAGAQEVIALEQKAEFFRKNLRFAQAEQALNRADEIRGGLKNLIDAERNPFGAMETGIAESSASLKKLERAVNPDGSYNVTPFNGE